ncbi:FecR family protein [Pedobacter antarcticus]|uniref:FecR family protein n=1 Tax=Pedobacter antarcticus TaxID=34086 RepID=UPI00292EAFF9|nr:FecR domain-containing protein [Pedobacter antarcticus]
MSSNNNTMDDGLLVKYLMNEADTREAHQVESWLRDNTKNQQYLHEFKLIWEESAALTAGSEDEDESAAWNRLENRLHLNDAVVVKAEKIVSNSWLRVAASILLIGGLAWFGIYSFRSPELITVQSNATVLSKMLPDGSEITLNKNSEIIYSSIFKGDTRPVTLRGEAFFRVAPNAGKPFIITVNGITVKVVGTSFNIKSTENKTVVIVETGIVQVSKGDSVINLNPGERSIVTGDQARLSKEHTQSKLYNYYRTNELVCEDTPLQELVDVLNEIHHANIVIGTPALKNREITANFKNQSLDEIISVIKETFKIQADYKNQQILLK